MPQVTDSCYQQKELTIVDDCGARMEVRETHLHEPQDSQLGPSMEVRDTHLHEPQDSQLGPSMEVRETHLHEPQDSQLGPMMEVREKHLHEPQDSQLEPLTDIQVGADFFERRRRAQEEEASQQRIRKLENEAVKSYADFVDITDKMDVALKKNTHQEMVAELKSLQEICALSLQSKDKLIDELQEQLIIGEDKYGKNLNKQAKDVNLTITRMEEQINNLQKSYREEMDNIERDFEEERKAVMDRRHMNMEEARNMMHDKSIRYLNRRMEKVEQFEIRIKDLYDKNYELYYSLKAEMQDSTDTLEQHLQRKRNTCHLNSEMIKYNFQSLKGKEVENTEILYNLKRQLPVLQCVSDKLQRKCAYAKELSRKTKSKMNDCVRVVDYHKYTEKKIRDILAFETTEFADIRLMYEDEVRELVKRALEIEKLVHTLILGVKWVPSCLVDTWVPPYLTVQTEEESITDSGEETKPLNKLVSRQTWNDFLKYLNNEGDFLIDGDVIKLPSGSIGGEMSHIKLNLKMKALGINNQKDLLKLAEYFILHRDGKETFELIHPNEVVNALKGYTGDYCKHKGSQKREENVTQSHWSDEATDASYWERMSGIIPESRLKIWDDLEQALQKYHAVLKERSRLVQVTMNLQQENQELNNLLKEKMNSKGLCQPVKHL